MGLIDDALKRARPRAQKSKQVVTVNYGFPVLSTFAAAFALLKMLGYLADWSWWWVAVPLVPTAFAITVVLATVLLAAGFVAGHACWRKVSASWCRHN